ncbi:acyltransferase [Thiotrichales bacterium HSG1]|nr:acyltransferase [Thiotrichales bacterium HSG1]
MSDTLSSYTVNRNNNFNLIRFVAALLVLITHSFALSSGTADAEPFRATLGITLGNFAVDVFFVTSGFLITGSLFARNNLIAFVWARMLRIYPALIVAILFCVFAVGLYFTTLSFWEYISNNQTHKYLVKNILLFFGINYNLPGVFADTPYVNVINGSLWTLPYEVKMYAILVIFGSILLSIEKWFNQNRAKVPIFGYCLLIVVVVAIVANIINQSYLFMNKYALHLFTMFFIGATFYVWREKIIISELVVLLILLILIPATLNKQIFFIFYSIFIPYIVFYIAYVPTGKIRLFNQLGDYSYGMYIYAFPVQQSIATLIVGISVGMMIAISFVITLLLAILSWHLVEKRSLRLKNKYILVDSLIINIRFKIMSAWVKLYKS